MVNNIRIDVIADPMLFEELDAEAARLDRSVSWIVQQCLRAALPALAKIAYGSPSARALETGVLRDPIRLASLRANLALAESGDPTLQDAATIPHGTVKRMLLLQRDIYDAFDAAGDRLKLAADEIVAFCWRAHAAEIRKLSPVAE